MNEKKLMHRVAQLETLNDQLVSEIRYIDTIARELGFREGLKTLKEAAEELLEEQREESSNGDDFPPLAG